MPAKKLSHLGGDVTRVKAKKSARESKKTAKGLKKMPKTRAALARGDINEEHADAAAEGRSKCRRRKPTSGRRNGNAA